MITKNHSGIFDTFTSGVNGLEVIPKSAQSIADALCWEAENKNELYRFSTANLMHARLKYRSDVHVKKLSDILNSIEID